MATTQIDLSPGFRLRAHILRLLRARPMTAVELAECMPYPFRAIQGALTILANAGHIQRRNARWELADVVAGDQPPAA